jgi:hypothetical protein
MKIQLHITVLRIVLRECLQKLHATTCASIVGLVNWLWAKTKLADTRLNISRCFRRYQEGYASICYTRRVWHYS